MVQYKKCRKRGGTLLKIAICDDEQLWLENTASMLWEYYSGRTDPSVKVHVFSSPYDLLESLDDNAGFDLYILDVVMPEFSGIQLGARLRKMDQRGLIIYLTTSKDFALDAYEVEPFHYLLKPVEKDKFFSVLDKAMAILTARRNRAISVKTKDGIRQIFFDDILYVEFAERCCHYYLKDGNVVVANQLRASFTDIMLPLLRDERFCRCGASFVLNLHYVQSVDKAAVWFRNTEKSVCLPKNAAATLLSAWLDYWMEGENKS